MSTLEVLRALKETLEGKCKKGKIDEAVFGWILDRTIKTLAVPDPKQLRADVIEKLFHANIRRSLQGKTDSKAPFVDSILANLDLAITLSVECADD